MRELRCAIESVDSGCPNQHYTKYVDTLQHTVQLKGHPLVCSNDGGCHSQLQIIRSAATHYPVLVKSLNLKVKLMIILSMYVVAVSVCIRESLYQKLSSLINWEMLCGLD